MLSSETIEVARNNKNRQFEYFEARKMYREYPFLFSILSDEKSEHSN